jgi:hypothetical protein
VNVIPQASHRAEKGAGAALTVPPVTLIEARGKTASDAFSLNEYLQLGLHLNNKNGKDYVVAFRVSEGVRFTRSKSKTAETNIKRAWHSTKENAWEPMSFAPYSTNDDGMSRWGALDFDCHALGGEDHVYQKAFRCWQALLNQAPCVIYEHSGRGWHVWLAWRDFKAANWINALLRKAALDQGCDLESGKVEIFPPAAPTGFGKAMRLPGTFNPSTGRCSTIFYENVRESEILNPLYVRKGVSSRTNLTNTEKNDLCKVSLYREWDRDWCERFEIRLPNTRNDLLMKLVLEVFNQVGYGQAEFMAGLQFDGKQVTTQENRGQHMKEFRAVWAGCEKRFTVSLNNRERLIYESLRRQSQRDKFRIVRSWSQFARDRGHREFPISIASLAERVGEAIPSVSAFRNLLIQREVLHQLEAYEAGVKCGRYRWLLEETP